MTQLHDTQVKFNGLKWNAAGYNRVSRLAILFREAAQRPRSQMVKELMGWRAISLAAIPMFKEHDHLPDYVRRRPETDKLVADTVGFKSSTVSDRSWYASSGRSSAPASPTFSTQTAFGIAQIQGRNMLTDALKNACALLKRGGDDAQAGRLLVSYILYGVETGSLASAETLSAVMQLTSMMGGNADRYALNARLSQIGGRSMENTVPHCLLDPYFCVLVSYVQGAAYIGMASSTVAAHISARSADLLVRHPELVRDMIALTGVTTWMGLPTRKSAQYSQPFGFAADWVYRKTGRAGDYTAADQAAVESITTTPVGRWIITGALDGAGDYVRVASSYPARQQVYPATLLAATLSSVVLTNALENLKLWT